MFYRDVAKIDLYMGQINETSFTFECKISNVKNADTPALACISNCTVVVVSRNTHKKMSIPATLFEQLKSATFPATPTAPSSKL